MTDSSGFASANAREYFDALALNLLKSTACEQREAQAVVLRLLDHYAGLNLASILAGTATVAADAKILAEKALEKIIAGQPLQYALGAADFYGRRFAVGPAVLIPRRETEELVDLIIRDRRAAGGETTILDLATGSGCIAATLAAELPDARVFATDISPEALNVARHNFDANETRVTLACHDMLSEAELPFDTDFDIIASNPPYVMRSETPTIPPNVLNHEPHLALFVADAAPLVFHEACLRIAAARLRPGGRLYVEINEKLGRETAELFESRGFDAEIIRDMSGRDRIVKSTKGFVK
ncbi:MAG: peptide chain release factor N(5)-glutamine methyltransferase [Prevotellaceae bacterium]|jgi:release factor glutamine methyltransferase|nr:peptide chain release factor N(5)-glutamine methyltransferase [Prevotellaceae bacterium]